MAKKITIAESGILQSTEDAWGGVNNTNETIIPYEERNAETEVPAGAEWGVNRGEVERFIKEQLNGKVGYLYRDENNQLLAFATSDDFLAWQSDPENNPPVASTTLPSITQSDVYQVRAYLQSTPYELQRSRDVTIEIRGTSIVQLAAGGTENVQEDLNVLIETSPTGASGTWTSRIVGTVVANSQEYKAFSLQNYISTGINYVRIRVSGNASGETITSIPISFTINVVDLYLIPRIDFENPVTSPLVLSYLIGGSVEKTINFQFGVGRGNSFQSAYSIDISLGTQTSTQTAKQFQFDRQEILSVGRHTVRARLYVNENMYTDWIENEYMVAGDSKLVIINDIQSGLSNWTAIKFFDWAAYSPDNEDFNVVFKLYDENEESLLTSPWTFTASNGEKYSFTTQLSLNIPSNVSVFAGIMHIEDENGNTLCPSVSFNFLNNADFSPEEGADFVMIPANRNNSESAKDTIINEAGSTPTTVGSNFTGFGWLNDGWINVPKDLNDDSAGTLRALHIPAEHKVEINYNPFSDFTGNSNSGKNATFEIDFRTSNILDDEEPVVRIGTLNNGKIWGFEMLPTKAYMLTSEKNSIQDQDVDWAEDVRTHLAINIVTVVYSNTTLNYVRIFINGIIEREFLYNTTDRFTAESGVKIELGNSTCDLDVFGIRNYKVALNTSAVMKDYIASMDTIEEKLAFKNKNDIIENEQINFADCIQKGYNVIGHTGTLPKYGIAEGNPTYSGITLQIHINGDTEHSCILTNLDASGQGTTAMGYYDWNQSYKIKSNTKHYTEDGVPKDISDGSGYSIANDEYAAKKLVGKINFASSMQSHKLGLTWIYTEVFKALVSNGTISCPGQMKPSNYPYARISVFEKPFLFFHRETENDEWTYKYLMTFGAGKGDKPTFGFNNSKTGNMFMVEGADNDPALCNFAMPWDDSVEYHYKVAGEKKEAWYVGSVKSINFGFGKTVEVGNEELPDNENALNAIKAFWNFVFEHHTGITYYNGSLQNLRDGEPLVEGNKAISNSGLYWIATSGVNQYELFRYDSAEGWIAAGANKTTFNLREQYKTFNNNTYPSWNGLTNKQINDDILAKRRAHFKANAESFFHVDDALYHSCFVKLFAGTDNRAKNTYYYTDPEDLKIRWMQDDLDTVIKTNNLGQNRKPYYVEEHDKDAYGAYYWQGERNGFYNLLEECYSDDKNLQNDRMGEMMATMLSAMSSIGGSVMNYFLQRILFVQDYFPAIAYNEQARLVYEAAQAAQTGNNPVYTNAIQAITQSCGSQRWSEYQWLLDRVMYISSWCSYGEFAAGTTNVNALGFRSASGDFNFALTPAKWMYPKIGKGQSVMPAKVDNNLESVYRVRCEPKETFNYQTFNSEGDVDVYVRGIHYMLDVGDMNIPITPAAFPFIGKRLQEINVNPDGDDTNYLRASSITNTATNIKSFVVKNVDTVSGSIDLSKCYRLEHIDISGSTFTGIILPETERLTSISLPASITSLNLDGQPNLAILELESIDNLQTLRIIDIPTIIKVNGSSRTLGELLIDVLSADPFVLTNITLRNFTATMSYEALENLMEVANRDITGTIYVSGNVDFEQALHILEEFSGDSGLTVEIINKTSIIGATIYTRDTHWNWGYCDKYVGDTNYSPYKFMALPNQTGGNNVKSVVWSIDKEVDGQTSDVLATIDSSTGIMNVVRSQNNGLPIKVKCTITCISVNDGTEYTIDVEQVINFGTHNATLGDYVYADGTFSNVLTTGKTVVGVCFYISGNKRLMVTLRNFSYSSYVLTWGLDNNTGSGYYGVAGLSSDVYGFNPYYIGITSQNENIVWTNEPMDGVNTNDSIPSGKHQTLNIILRRNRLLKFHEIIDGIENANGIMASPIPSGENEMNELFVKSTNFANAASALGLTRGSYYHSFYHRIPSAAYAYEPSIKDWEKPLLKFGKHTWWLPSYWEASRLIASVQTNGTKRTDRVTKNAEEAGIFIDFTAFSNNDSNGYVISTEYGNDGTIWSLRFYSSGAYASGVVHVGYESSYRKSYPLKARFINQF